MGAGLHTNCVSIGAGLHTNCVSNVSMGAGHHTSCVSMGGGHLCNVNIITLATLSPTPIRPSLVQINTLRPIHIHTFQTASSGGPPSLCPHSWFHLGSGRGDYGDLCWRLLFLCFCVPFCYPCYLSRQVRRRQGQARKHH